MCRQMEGKTDKQLLFLYIDLMRSMGNANIAKRMHADHLSWDIRHLPHNFFIRKHCETRKMRARASDMCFISMFRLASSLRPASVRRVGTRNWTGRSKIVERKRIRIMYTWSWSSKKHIVGYCHCFVIKEMSTKLDWTLAAFDLHDRDWAHSLQHCW